MAGVGRVCRSTDSSVGTALRAAKVASAPSSPMSSAGGWMPRAMSRSSAIASLAPRWAASTSSRTRSRSTWSGSSSSFSLAMPSRMAKATSCAWVPSWRSRSIRRKVAALASTVWVRACSSERTRVAIGSGPSRLPISSRSTLTKPRMTHGAAKRKMAPRMKTPTSWMKLAWNWSRMPGKMPLASPHTGAPPPFRPRTGCRRQANASHHRLTATRKPRMVHGTLTAR